MLHEHPLRFEVHRLLRADWSPQQIAQMLPVLFPDDPRMRVSHETIYQSLFGQAKGELNRELGYAFVVIGLVDGFVMPTVLARKWSSRRE